MRRKLYLLAAIAGVSICCGPVSASAQSAAVPPQQSSVTNDLLSELTPDQRDQYKAAVQLFSAENYADALGAFRKILSELKPGTPTYDLVAKFTAEAAIDAGDSAYALQLLKPIEALDASDWQAAGLLARIYAETGQKQLRDAELAHLADLHKRGVTPQIARMQQIFLERIPVATGFVRVWYSLEPWGRYKTYVFARVYDQSKQQVLRITLESSDFDQAFFAQQHPDLAARGLRRFSLDGYGQDQQLPNGQVAQSHFTFGIYDDQPTYDTVRERIIRIAEKKEKPFSRTDRPVTR